MRGEHRKELYTKSVACHVSELVSQRIGQARNLVQIREPEKLDLAFESAKNNSEGK